MRPSNRLNSVLPPGSGARRRQRARSRSPGAGIATPECSAYLPATEETYVTAARCRHAGAGLYAAEEPRRETATRRFARPSRDPRVLSRGLESCVRGRAHGLQRGAAGVPTISRRAARHLGGRRVVSQGLRVRAAFRVSAAGGFRAEGRGVARLRRLSRAGRILGTRAVRARQGRCDPLELSLARRRESRRRRDPRGIGGAQVTARLTPPVSARDHAQGPADAPVTLVEYGDYECPHCGRAYPMVKAIQRSLGNGLRFVFRNFPLAKSHEHPEHAAEIAEP